MQKAPPKADHPIRDNLVWFGGSLLLAFVVWMIATFQSDPVREQRFPERIAVRMTPDPGLLITSPPPANRFASVVIRAPESVLALLTSDEIEVWADLHDLGPGEHIVDLHYEISRQRATVIDFSPSRIRVTLEEAAQRQVPLRALIVGEPPAGYVREEPVFDIALNQVLVSGAASLVNKVVAAQVELDLRRQRNPLEVDARLSPVDAEGKVVADVTLDPSVVRVTVSIRRRDDVREISVQPNLRGNLPEGYVLNAISYEPQTLLISGTPSQLAALPDTLSTEPIDLKDHSDSFSVDVPVVLPDTNLLLLSGPNITVSIEISPVMSSKQFDDIPIEVLGIREDTLVRITPNQVSIFITGPQAQISSLTEQDIRAVLDLNGLGPGNYALRPMVSINQKQLPAESVSILPAEVDVEITSAPPPEATQAADG
jgi:YbbR domain-containing protein